MAQPDDRPLRRRVSEVVLPLWLTLPLAVLGIGFILLYPLGQLDWYTYGSFLSGAVVVALWSRSRYRVEIIRPKPGVYVTRIEDRKHVSAATDES